MDTYPHFLLPLAFFLDLSRLSGEGMILRSLPLHLVFLYKSCNYISV